MTMTVVLRKVKLETPSSEKQRAYGIESRASLSLPFLNMKSVIEDYTESCAWVAKWE